MNPLKSLPIYGKDVSNFYQQSENVRSNLPPHIYATAENCYREMMRTQQSQCILISGESGSGKTETCKYLVQHLLNRTKPFEVYLNAKIQEVKLIKITYSKNYVFNIIEKNNDFNRLILY